MALSPACGCNKPPNSLFDAAGYHVRGDAVYYLNAFPGKPFEIDDADADTFQAGDGTYAHDASAVYFHGSEVPGADPATFELLDRPGLFKDHRHVYQRDRPISDDPAHFELLDGDLMKDSATVYWSDESVLPEDPTHFAIISNADQTRFPTPILQPSAWCGARMRVTTGISTTSLTWSRMRTRPRFERWSPYAADSAQVYWMGKTIDGADPTSFRVLNAAFARSADAQHAYYRQTVIAGAAPYSFPANRPVTNCDEMSISFAD